MGNKRRARPVDLWRHKLLVIEVEYHLDTHNLLLNSKQSDLYICAYAILPFVKKDNIDFWGQTNYISNVKRYGFYYEYDTKQFKFLLYFVTRFDVIIIIHQKLANQYQFSSWNVVVLPWKSNGIPFVGEAGVIVISMITVKLHFTFLCNVAFNIRPFPRTKNPLVRFPWNSSIRLPSKKLLQEAMRDSAHLKKLEYEILKKGSSTDIRKGSKYSFPMIPFKVKIVGWLFRMRTLTAPSTEWHM